jgi:hypothetical protein
MAAPFTPIGTVDSDAARRLAWLKQQVCPTLRRLQEWYSRADLIALLFDGADLSEIRQVRREADPGLTGYDEWSVHESIKERQYDRTPSDVALHGE